MAVTQRIYIMRHGESTVNLTHRLTCRQYKGDLTGQGRKQAHQAGKWLADKDITAIYASPFHRAQETAAIIGEYLYLTPVTQDGLREVDCGSLETKPDGWRDYVPLYRRWLAGELDARFPDGESLQEAIDRYSHVLEMACASGENALLVTHGNISRAVFIMWRKG